MKTINKNKLLTTAWYHLYQGLFQGIFLTLTLAVNLIIGVIILSASGGEHGGGTTDAIAMGWSFFLGLIMFGYGFKLAVENGASRKTYFLALLAAAALTALLWAAVSFIATLFAAKVGAFALTYLIYGKIGFGHFLFNLTIMLMLYMLGIMIRLIIRRTSKKVKYIILMSFVVAVAALTAASVLSGGRVLTGIGKFFAHVLGLTAAAPNAYIASAFFFGLFLVFSACSYLLLRRAEIR